MAEHPGGRLRRRAGRAASGQGGGAGVWGQSPVEEQHLPPGVEMGRNGPQHRPGSETPRPLPGAGDVPEGNHSASHRPPSPSPSPFRPSRPLPSLLFPLGRWEGGSPASRGPSCPRPRRRGGGERGGLRGRGGGD